MYGHPDIVVVHARALSPSGRVFWAWYNTRSQQLSLDLVVEEGVVEEVEAVELEELQC